MLLKLSHLKCENPRDKVYALLGLVGPEFRINADYSPSPEQVLYQVLDKVAKDEGPRLPEEKQLDVGITLRRSMNIVESDKISEEIANIVYRYVAERLLLLEEPLSPADEAADARFYIKYVKKPNSLRIPHRVRLNDPLGESTFVQRMLDKQMRVLIVASTKAIVQAQRRGLRQAPL